ncbi:unnamed protein product [Pleuronectes platessa]|uniref:Uncharacterized protein n=1 Tax=Pleuronectes platessa TaxID=8262 RepID=A0A9N7VFC1_PLEPL|nr:unnamed protein product [Pleuronectes platessa]
MRVFILKGLVEQKAPQGLTVWICLGLLEQRDWLHTPVMCVPTPSQLPSTERGLSLPVSPSVLAVFGPSALLIGMINQRLKYNQPGDPNSDPRTDDSSRCGPRDGEQHTPSSWGHTPIIIVFITLSISAQ